MEEHLQKVGAGSSPMTAEISQEAVDRMAKLIRDYVAACAHCTVGGQFLTEARAIVAMLPVEEDPDLLECREILAREAVEKGWPNNAIIWRSGGWDGERTMAMMILALKRGRELAKARAGEGSV